MIEPPAKCKLTGDAKRLWDILIESYGTVLKQRHSAMMFAMCQQWDLYQKSLAKLKRNKDEKREWTLHCQMTSSLKQFKSMADRFAMGINDQLEFSVPGKIPDSKAKKPQSRLGELLSGIGASNN